VVERFVSIMRRDQDHFVACLRQRSAFLMKNPSIERIMNGSELCNFHRSRRDVAPPFRYARAFRKLKRG
jgi:hypothetical protein